MKKQHKGPVQVANTWDGIIELEMRDRMLGLSQTYRVTAPDIFGKGSALLEEQDPNEILRSVLENCPFDKSDLVSLNVQNLPVSTIPDSITSYQSLKKVKLLRNAFVAFPSALLEVKTLESITIFDSQINAIPEEISQLSKLKHWNMFESEFTQVPSSLYNLTNLEYLGLCGAQIAHIPTEIGKLKALRKLDLYKNRIQHMPDEIGQLQHLEVLWLHGNELGNTEKLKLKQLLPETQVIY